MANEIFKSKGVLIGSAAVGLIAVGGVAAYVISQNSAPAPAPVADAVAPGAPGAPPTLALPKPPGQAKAPAIAKATPAPGTAAKPAVATPPKLVATNSWEELAPTTTPAAPAPGPASAPGGPPAGGTAPAAAEPAAAGAKPSPIVQGELAAGFRPDPFVSFTRRLVEAIPTYSLIAHERLAARPKPTPPAAPTDPYLRFGPLPQVERRIAGILFDGSVSAILETGTPGAATTRVSVIQPGSLVPSGVPGLRDLTVASITATEVVLRADDGRTTTVKLSSVPAAYAEAFRGAASGNDSSGGNTPPGGPQGGPPAPLGSPGRGGRGGAGGGPSRPFGGAGAN